MGLLVQLAQTEARKIRRVSTMAEKASPVPIAADEEICNTIMGEHWFEWARNRAILLGVNWNDIEVFSELFPATERADVEGTTFGKPSHQDEPVDDDDGLDGNDTI